MSTHCVRAIVDADHRITVKLPDDFPIGEVELTVRSQDEVDAEDAADLALYRAGLKEYEDSGCASIPLEQLRREMGL